MVADTPFICGLTLTGRKRYVIRQRRLLNWLLGPRVTTEVEVMREWSAGNPFAPPLPSDFIWRSERHTDRMIVMPIFTGAAPNA